MLIGLLDEIYWVSWAVWMATVIIGNGIANFVRYKAKEALADIDPDSKDYLSAERRLYTLGGATVILLCFFGMACIAFFKAPSPDFFDLSIALISRLLNMIATGVLVWIILRQEKNLAKEQRMQLSN